MKRVLPALGLGLLAAAGLHAMTPGARSSDRRPLAIDREDGGPLREVAMHFDPEAAGTVLTTYRQILAALAPETRVRMAVANDEAARAAREGLGELAARMHTVSVGRPITTWSRDRYWLATEDRRRILLVPKAMPAINGRRAADELAPFAFARASGADVRRLPLRFDGGDAAVGGGRMFVTPTLAARNAGTALADPRELRRALARIFGLEVVMLGARPEDVPPHHVGMFLAPIGDTVVVGDVDLGIRLARESGTDVEPTSDPAALERFRRIVRELEARPDLRVVRAPLVPLEDPLTYVTYTNALMEHRGAVLHVYLPQFGLPDLDRAGREVYERLGAIVHPIDVSRVYVHRGTVHCLVHVLERGA